MADNTHILPHLDDPRLLAIKYEDFADKAGVLGVLRRLAEFVGAAPVEDDRLLLALQPPVGVLPAGHQCAVFEGEEQKVADLTASYLQLLAGQGEAAKGEAPRAVYHNRYRSWQASRAWAPQVEPTWPRRLSCEQQAAAAADAAVRSMLQRFGYPLERPGTNSTACLQSQSGDAVDATPVLARPAQDPAPLATA